MSLRELPPEQAVRPDRWRHLRYVPLVALLICSVIAALGGFYVTQLQKAALAENVTAPVAPMPSADTTIGLPEECTPAVAAPSTEPWTGAGAADAEAVFLDHSQEVSEPYVVGRDGFVYWGDIQAQNFSQAIGRRALTVAEAAGWRDYLVHLRDGLDEMDIPLYIVVAPAKWGVYPEKLPEWTDGIRGSSALDQILAGNPDLPLIDVRAPLREASIDDPTYSSVNSHWTDYGAAVAWQSIASCIADTDPALAAIHLPEMSGITVSDGGSEFAEWGFTAPEPDWTTPEFTDPLLPVTVALMDGPAREHPGDYRVGLEEMPAETWTDGAQVDASALVVRDSFGVSLSPYIHQSFAHTWQIRHSFDYPADQQPDILAVARQNRPDVVILQVAQRHLMFPPPIPAAG